MPNRLAESSSPYLLQHAHNPVDWFPWGKEALDKAKIENKLILLSIGYSACHWCHVMEHNCFEDEGIAALMNEHFVNIKVDREERPDVDNLYMDALHLMGLPGGWPLNVFLTPEQLPFYGGTYFPPNQWSSILEQIAKAHSTKPEELRKIGEQNRLGLMSSEHQRFMKQEDKRTLQDLLENGNRLLKQNFDAEWGGFGQAPKFPMPCVYRFLLHQAAVKKSPECREMTLFSLEKIACGGIQDLIGGGFARYSVDAEWRIPHFEKMLYDNAQLCSLYSIAWLEDKKEVFKSSAKGIFRFIQAELSHPDGGFFSALDADSEGEEGRFYVWTRDEIKEELGNDFPLFSSFYDLPEAGNFEHGKSVIRSLMTESDFLLNKPAEEAESIKLQLQFCREKLLQKRSGRVRPGLDDKIICSWNALMISGLCDSYRAFSEPEYLERAIQCANFIKKEMWQGEQGLFRIWKNGRGHTDGFLDDYANLILACIDLSECGVERDWLLLAETLSDYVIRHFSDEEDGLFFYTSDESEALVARKKEISDNVIPSSNAQMAMALHRLGRLLYREDFSVRVRRMIDSVRPMLRGDLRYVSQWMQVLLMEEFPPADIVLIGKNANEFRQLTEQLFLPGRTIQVSIENQDWALAKGKSAKPGETCAFICSGQHCLAPIREVNQLSEILRSFRSDS